jgi:uncharacterized protein YoxC
MEETNVNANVATPNAEITVNGNAEMLTVDKKNLFWQRISAMAVVAMFLVVLVTALTVVPQVLNTLNSINKVAVDAEAAIGDVEVMVSEITSASKNLNKLVDDNDEKLTEAVTNLSSVDFDGLNAAIKDLQDTVGPMANFFSRFR